MLSTLKFCVFCRIISEIKLEFYMIFELAQKKTCILSKISEIFFCILQKLFRKFLVHVKKIIYIYILKTVQAGKN